MGEKCIELLKRGPSGGKTRKEVHASYYASHAYLRALLGTKTKTPLWHTHPSRMNIIDPFRRKWRFVRRLERRPHEVARAKGVEARLTGASESATRKGTYGMCAA